MPETIARGASVLETVAIIIGGTAGITVRNVQRLRARIRERKLRSGTSAALPALKQEIGDQAAYLMARTRYYHRRQPIKSVAAVSAAAFVVGAAIGIGRH